MRWFVVAAAMALGALDAGAQPPEVKAKVVGTAAVSDDAAGAALIDDLRLLMKSKLPLSELKRLHALVQGNRKRIFIDADGIAVFEGPPLPILSHTYKTMLLSSDDLVKDKKFAPKNQGDRFKGFTYKNTEVNKNHVFEALDGLVKRQQTAAASEAPPECPAGGRADHGPCLAQ